MENARALDPPPYLRQNQLLDAGEMKAIWFFGTDAIEVIDGSGTVIERLPVESPPEEVQRAA